MVYRIHSQVGAHLQQDPAVGIYIGPGVLGLALLQQDVGGHLVDVRHQPEHRIVGQVLECKLSLARVTWVCGI